MSTNLSDYTQQQQEILKDYTSWSGGWLPETKYECGRYTNNMYDKKDPMNKTCKEFLYTIAAQSYQDRTKLEDDIINNKK